MTFAIEAVSLTKSYGRARGIVDVDLAVEPGEVMGLVGANGAGKTTLMRTLLDFIRPNSGSLRVLGMDSVRESVGVRRKCAYLPGELVLPARLTGHDVLRRFAFARHGLSSARVDQLATRLDLDLTRRVGELSKGNKQKVGLVLAFAPEVELLVLDEPTSGLDPLLQREFAAMAHEAAAAGRTVLLSSHVMSEVEQIAGRVALMHEGRLTAVEDMETLRVRSRRRCRVSPAAAVDLPRLESLLAGTPGVSDVVRGEGEVAFALDGAADPVLKALATLTIATVEIRHADLEEEFFAVYDGSSQP